MSVAMSRTIKTNPVLTWPERAQASTGQLRRATEELLGGAVLGGRRDGGTSGWWDRGTTMGPGTAGPWDLGGTVGRRVDCHHRFRF